MANAFLGSGLQFPIVSANGSIVLARYEECIRQSIWMILGTAKGERIMRPDFGCGIHNLIFAPNGSAALSQIANEVRDALMRWEARIDVLMVDTLIDPNEASRLLIQIDYRVRTTNNRFNLVYPFYLE